MNKEYKGFIEPVITPDNHVLGGVGIPLPVINPSGDWRPYTPTFESQLQTTFDTFGCTVYGTLNAIETLNKFLTGKEENYSDRFTYNDVGITPPGSDPHLVATKIRGSGLLKESDLPSVTSSLSEFMTPRPLFVALRVKAQQWLNERMLGHKWLWEVQPDAETRIALLKEGLTKGTVCVSVDAWYQNEQGLYYSPNTINAHWTFITYVEDGVGIHCYDSYNDAKTNTNLKILTLDHNIRFAKVYYFTKPTQQQNWFIQLITSLLSVVGLYEKQIEVVKPINTSSEAPISPVVESKPDNTYNEVKESLKSNMIEKWAKLIEKFEGAPKYLNNPGNFKYSPLIASWGGKKDVAGSDGGYFARFDTYEQGRQALVNFLILGCKNELKSYKTPPKDHPNVNPRTIKGFTLVYTNFPTPKYDYSDNIIKGLGVSADTLISSFLS